MKKTKIVLLALLLLILTVGAVSAIDIMSFKSPKGFDEGYGGSMTKGKFSISIDDYDSDLNKDLFKGDNIHPVTVKGNFGEFNDTFKEEVGAREIIQIGKENYTIECKYDGKDVSKISECVKYLEEFNKKNDLKPVDLSKINFND